MSGLLQRAIRASILDPAVYEEVETDPRAIGEAAHVVLFASLAGGLGAGWSNPRNMILGALLTFLGWLIWAALTYGFCQRLRLMRISGSCCVPSGLPARRECFACWQSSPLEVYRLFRHGDLGSSDDHRGGPAGTRLPGDFASRGRLRDRLAGSSRSSDLHFCVSGHRLLS